jgi:5-methylcytosine-specific restriction endonuclease McrA
MEKNDYRCTPYCASYGNIVSKKSDFMEEIKKEHPRAADIYSLVKERGTIPNERFKEIYNKKCAYCGASVDVLSREGFEIDHYISKDVAKKSKHSKGGNHIENLVLACSRCNQSKKGYEIDDDIESILHPDCGVIESLFNRNSEYGIDVAPEYKDNVGVKNFYRKLKLGDELRRLDYLIMSIKGMQHAIQGTGNEKVYELLGSISRTLVMKR